MIGGKLRLWQRTGLTVHKEIYRAEKKGSQNVLMTLKLFQNKKTTFFDTKRQNCQPIVLLQTAKIDLQHFSKKKLTKSEMS